MSGISGMIGMFLGTLLGLGIWMPLGILGIVLLISGPSMLLAYLKLRQRNLAPILDANGWAINTKAKMNVPFGAALTHVAKLPANAERSLTTLTRRSRTRGRHGSSCWPSSAWATAGPSASWTTTCPAR